MAKKKSTGIDWMGLAKAVIKAATAFPTPMHRRAVFGPPAAFHLATDGTRMHIPFSILPAVSSSPVGWESSSSPCSVRWNTVGDWVERVNGGVGMVAAADF